MVQLKVDEEVAKKKAELEAKLAEMEARFAAENDAMRMELEEKTSMGAADQVTGRHCCHHHLLHHHSRRRHLFGLLRTHTAEAPE